MAHRHSDIEIVPMEIQIGEIHAFSIIQLAQVISHKIYLVECTQNVQIWIKKLPMVAFSSATYLGFFQNDYFF